MQQLDLHVIQRALQWVNEGKPVWLCTVLATFGSSPREPGSMLVAQADGTHVGSLSGGCVEEDFLARLRDDMFDATATVIRYGEGELGGPQVTLPCGGILDVLVERLLPSETTLQHLSTLHTALLGQRPLIRCVRLDNGQASFVDGSALGAVVERHAESVLIRIGPALRLIIAGISPVSSACAEFAHALGYEVIVCDPRPEMRADFNVAGVELNDLLPSSFIASGGCHSSTAVVALTHDPRIDDLAMIEAVRTPAFYIGVMGSQQTSARRAERLQRSGGLSKDDVARIHMPIGLALGSKTPAEIALAVMADILRIHRDRPRDLL